MDLAFIAAALLPHPPILVPEIGRGEENFAKSTREAVELVAQRFSELEPDLLVLISPHGALFQDTITALDVEILEGSLSSFGAPQIHLSYENDQELLRKLYDKCYKEKFPLFLINKKMAREYELSTSLDHGAIVPLYFMEKKWKKKPKMIHINYGLLSPEELSFFGNLLSSVVGREKGRAVLLASGDLSHHLGKGDYAYREEGKVFDEKIQQILREGKLQELLDLPEDLIERAGECGLRSLEILQGALESGKYSIENLSYEAPWGVGYLVSYMKGEESMKKDLYLDLVLETLETYFKTGLRFIPHEKYASILERRGACFVSLHKYGKLRGCIGTLFPREDNLAEEIISNTLSASLEDSRFLPVKKEEIEDLVLQVDLLGDLEETNLQGLDPNIYGVIVKKGRKLGVLLPDLQGIETVDQQVALAKEKASLQPEEEVELLRFKVERHGQ